ncbi:MAG TPA: methylmalonyl-CoA decarboxylase [Nitrososphaerales archaeon]|nr:methylmalonyl-CoA decarboxylase [Nitrososphaerales archaeon]
MPLIQTKEQESIATIAFDNYSKRNALSRALIAETIAALDEFRVRGVRVVVLRSAATEKVWSAGYDVNELPKANIDPLPYSDPLENLLRAVKTFPAPVIGMVHGSVWGAACDLIMSCDLAYGDETCSFAITAAKLGLPYNIAGLHNFLSRVPLTIAKEMFFSANPIPARRAERVGIINELVPEAELESRVYAIAKTITARSPQAIKASKEAIHVLSEAVAINPSTYERLQGLRRGVYFGRDYQEGVQAFLEKRTPSF